MDLWSILSVNSINAYDILVFYAGCFSGQIRLVNGSGPNVGRLEICHNNRWEIVCNNGWSHTSAQVVCRQLGHTTDGSLN